MKCKEALGALQALGIGGRRAKKAGLDLCRQALELAKGEQRKEDYGYEAEMNLCGVPLRKMNHKGRKKGRFGAMSLS